MADLAGPLQPLEGADGLRERMGAAPVEQVEVDPVGREPPQAALAGGDRARGGSVVGIDLADQEDLVAPAGDRLADDLLGTAVGIHLGRVDQRQAEVEPAAQGRELGAAAGLVLAHAPGALAEHRHELATRQPQRTHGAQTLGSGVVRR